VIQKMAVATMTAL